MKFLPEIRSLFVSMLFPLLGVFDAPAAVIEWISPAGKWETATNWLGGAIPGAGDTPLLANRGEVTFDDISAATLADPGTDTYRVQMVRFIHGKFIMSGGKMESTTGDWVIFGNGRERGGGVFELEMSGDAWFRGQGPYFGDKNFGVGSEAMARAVLRDRATLTGKAGWAVIGRWGGVAEVEMLDDSRFILEQPSADGQFILADQGQGTLTMRDSSVLRSAMPVFLTSVSGTALLNVNDNALFQSDQTIWIGLYGNHVTNDAQVTVNLNGGTMAAPYLERNGNASKIVVNLNGGTLKALADEPNFLRVTGSGFTTAFATLAPETMTHPGGVTIDSNGHAIGFGASLDGPGKLTKTGTGTLTLGGVQSHTGGTSVNQGTLELASGVTFASHLKVNSGATMAVGGDPAVSAQVPDLHLADGSALLFKGLAKSVTTPRLRVTGTLTAPSQVEVYVSGFIIPGEYPLIAHDTPLAGGGAAAFVLVAPGLDATLEDKDGVLTLVVMGGEPPAGYEVKWNVPSGDVEVDENWLGGLAPGPNGIAVIDNGGEIVVNDGVDVSLLGAKFIHGSATMNGGSITFTSAGTQLASGQHGVASEFHLNMSGGARLRGAENFHFGDTNDTEFDSKAVVSMAGHASIINGSQWMVFGRFGGQALVDLAGHARIVQEETNPEYFLGLGERRGASNPHKQEISVINLRESSRLETHSSLLLGAHSGKAELNVYDNAEVWSATSIELGRSYGYGSIHLHGGTISADHFLWGMDDPNRNSFTADGGTIRALADQQDFFQYSKDGARPPYVILHAGGLQFDTDGHHVVSNAIFNGSGGFTKKGAGTFVMALDQPYKGGTKIEEGILAVFTRNGLLGTVEVAAGATMCVGGDPFDIGFQIQQDLNLAHGAHLAFPAIDSEGLDATLSVGGTITTHGTVWVQIPPGLETGSYPIINHFNESLAGDKLAAFQLATPGYTAHFEDDEFQLFLVIDAVVATGYEAWAAAAGLETSNQGTEQDPDHDGVPNLLEYYLGGDPLVPDSGILPRPTADAGNMRLSFRRSAEAAAALGEQVLELSGDLDQWQHSITIGANSSGPDAWGIRVEVVNAGPLQNITVTIPRTLGAGGKLFARLRVATAD